MTNSGIYKIINLQNNKYYVGSTKDFSRRKQTHFSKLKNNNHPNKHLQSSYNKYGFDNFKFEIIEYVDEKLLLDAEQLHIDNSPKEIVYNKTFIAGAGGYDNLSIPVYILDLNGNIINEFESIMDFCRKFNLSRIDYKTVNTGSIIKQKYRVVSKDFYNNEINTILNWKNYSNKSKEKSRLNKLKKKLLLIEENKTIEFKDQKEAGKYLGVSRERVRQILNSGSKKINIKYKYPELQFKLNYYE